MCRAIGHENIICPFLQSKKKAKETNKNMHSQHHSFYYLFLHRLIVLSESHSFSPRFLRFLKPTFCLLFLAPLIVLSGSKVKKETNAEEFLPLRKMEKFRIFKRRINRKKNILNTKQFIVHIKSHPSTI